MTIPPGAPGHGNGNTSVRAQPVLFDTPEGRRWNQVTGAYEVICYACGDDRDMNFSEVSPEIQRIRGPYATIEAAKTGLMEHIGARP